MEPQRIERKEVYKGKIFSVVEDTIIFENGKTTKWDLVLHNGASAIVPITDRGEIIFVRQYRNAEDGTVLEIPAGKLEKGEDPLVCAKRELEEETGYQADTLIPICSMYTAIGFSNEKLHLFMATGLKKGKQHLDEDEYIDVVTYPIEKAVELVFDGTIKDSKTIVGILAVAHQQRQTS
jgi:ADP-ribose pyrophosphatase